MNEETWDKPALPFLQWTRVKRSFKAFNIG